LIATTHASSLDFIVVWRLNEMQFKTRPFDPAAYLDSDEAIAGYMTETLDTNDPELIAVALDVTARARRLTQVARGADLSRESGCC
jgi:probable addiction module antidote protein